MWRLPDLAGNYSRFQSWLGVLYVIGVTQLALVRAVRAPTLAFTVSLAQQMCALTLRGLGVPAPEADLIAAQASDEIVRKGAAAEPNTRTKAH